MAEHTSARRRVVQWSTGNVGRHALLRAAQAHATVMGRDFVSPDDVKQVAPAALAHRIVLAHGIDVHAGWLAVAIDTYSRCIRFLRHSGGAGRGVRWPLPDARGDGQGAGSRCA